jgi:multicomponent K+:H+ antiporter subunit A
MTLAILALLPYPGSRGNRRLGSRSRNVQASLAAAATGAALVLLLSLAPAVLGGDVVTARLDGFPRLGWRPICSSTAWPDVRGTDPRDRFLIVIYARFYLAASDPMGRFYVFLLLFQGAMLGMVVSDNVLLLIVFWELTSISSFLLIGYWSHLPEARRGARMASPLRAAAGSR